jgi:hypothetical protein
VIHAVERRCLMAGGRAPAARVRRPIS